MASLNSQLHQQESQTLADIEKLELQKLELAQMLESLDESKNSQLQETMKNLNDANQKLKDDEVVVVQWQGKPKHSLWPHFFWNPV